jgi:hypothetical protein
MRDQQFASHAYCGAAGPVSKMVSQRKKASCVLRFEVPRSVITVQREFRARFKKDAPRKNNVTKWYRQFVKTGCLCTYRSSGRPRVFDDNIERVCEVQQLKQLNWQGEATVTGDSFLDMMVNWLLPKVNSSNDDYVLQLDGALPSLPISTRM